MNDCGCQEEASSEVVSFSNSFEEAEMEVKSELYCEKSFQKVKILDNSNSLITLKWSNHHPNNDAEVDEDGDLILPRKITQSVEIEFSQSTAIPLVGLQIWRGAFILADYILSEQKNFDGKVVLELAAGVGFTSVIAGISAKEVICTDIGKGGILDLIERNLARNKHLIRASTSVLPLDFCSDCWGVVLERKLQLIDIIIAADVIYDNELTEAFVRCLTKILKIPPKKTFFLALEKRFVFTVDDLDVVAPCYDHFFKYLKSYWSLPPMSSWKIDELDLNFEQKFDYERTKHLVLWKFTS